MTQMIEPVILEAVHIPFAKTGGALREVHPDALLAQTLDGLPERAGLDAENRGLSSLYNVRLDSLVPTSL
jgi:acetyl-CoA acetyltransferase